MQTLTPRTAIEALRLARTVEAAAKLELDMFWNGDGTCTAYSWKTNDQGKRVKSRYEVDLNAYSCTCDDFRSRGRFCKHLFRCEDVAREEAEEAFLESMADGEAFMANLAVEKSLR